MKAIFTSYAWAQIILLPLVVYYLNIDVKKVSWRHLRKIRISLILSILMLPVLLWVLGLAKPSVDGRARSGVENQPVIVSPPLPSRALISNNNAPPADHFFNRPVAAPFQRLSNRLSPSIGNVNLCLQAVSALARMLSAAGFILLFVKIYIDAAKLRHLTRSSQKRKLSSGDVLYTGDAIKTPFSLWLGKGLIFLPSQISAKAKNAILMHESCHTRRHHTLWRIVDLLHSFLFWYNPLAHLLRRRNVLVIELECDGEIAGDTGHLTLARTLFDYANENRNFRKRVLMGTQKFSAIKLLKHRMTYLLAPPNQKTGFFRWVGFLSIGAMLILSLIIFGCTQHDRQAKTLQQITQAYHARTAVHGSIQLSEIPPMVVSAFLLREDKNFNKHDGIDTPALFRAAFNTVTGNGLQGGSTITQQLAKMLLLADKKRTLGRKIEQLKMAKIIEKRFSKDDILEMYLNSLYFEKGVYGIKAASRLFFNHSVQALTPAESAALAVIVSQPEKNNFRKNPDKAKALQYQLMNRMVASGDLAHPDADRSFAAFWQVLQEKQEPRS